MKALTVNYKQENYNLKIAEVIKVLVKVIEVLFD